MVVGEAKRVGAKVEAREGHLRKVAQRLDVGANLGERNQSIRNRNKKEE